MSLRRIDWLLALASLAGALLACNAIIGVEDVRLAGPKERPPVTPGPVGGGDDDDDGIGHPLPGPDGSVIISGGKDIGTLALGFNHGCGRVPSGTVKCWGDNTTGQLGDGIPFDQTRPSEAETPQAVPGLSGVVDIASGLSHTCVVLQAGTVSCWGYNFFGQLGDGTQTKSPKPVAVQGLNDAVTVACGESFSCAIRRDKSVACWGADYSGQLGDGTKTTQRLTVANVPGLANVISLSGAKDHVCAVVEGGDLYCWGTNDKGQLGIGSTAESLAPTKLIAISSIAQVAIADHFSCARHAAGKVSCWGDNEHGQLGNGAPNIDPNPSPMLVPGIDDASFLWAGFDHACVARKSGSVSCWGADAHGQLGNDAPPDASVPTPVAAAGLTGAVRVWTGGDRSCGVTSDGHALCWGSNSLGELGTGSHDESAKPVPMVGFP